MHYVFPVLSRPDPAQAVLLHEKGFHVLSWDIAKGLSGDRGETMRRLRGKYLEPDLQLDKAALLNVVLITNTAEDIFFLLSKLEEDFNPYPLEDRALPLV